MLPNAAGVAVVFMVLQTIGRVPAMLKLLTAIGDERRIVYLEDVRAGITLSDKIADLLAATAPRCQCQRQGIQRPAGVPLLRPDGPIHFVGRSMGGLPERVFVAKYRPAQLGRVVLLARQTMAVRSPISCNRLPSAGGFLAQPDCN